MHMNVKFSDPLLKKEFVFTTTEELIVSYHTNIFNQYEIMLSYNHPSGVDISSKLEDFVAVMSPSNGMKIDIIHEDGTIIKSVRGNINEYVFRNQLNLSNNKMEPREQITITIFDKGDK